MEYTSLHHYLEHCFADKKTVSNQMVQQAKQDYRKMYLEKYQKQYRETKIQISFRISKKQYKVFQEQAKQQNIKTTSYVKQLVLQKQKNTSNFNNKTFKIILLEIIDVIEETIQENEIINTIKVLALLEQLQKQL